jgi:hypothetical protein
MMAAGMPSSGDELSEIGAELTGVGAAIARSQRLTIIIIPS